MRRVINAKLKVYWCKQDGVYAAILGLFPGVRGVGKTAEKALRDLSGKMQEYLDEVIDKGNTI